MSDFLLMAQYARQPIVKDRNSSGLIAWSASETAAAVPPGPSDEWVRQRIVAERIPQQTTNYVDRTMSYFLQDPATVANLRTYLSAWNEPAVENDLSQEINAVIAGFMPRFAHQDVSDAQVQAWRDGTAAGVMPAVDPPQRRPR
jgi:hypothetical protein